MQSWLGAAMIMITSLMQTACALPQQSMCTSLFVNPTRSIIGQLTTDSTAPNDITMSGKYQIELCGAQTATVKYALDSLWSALQPAITTTNYASANPIYNTFFHDSIYGPLVQQVLQNVSEGAAIPKTSSNGAPVSPLIACVTGPGIVITNTGGVVRDMWDQCNGNQQVAAFATKGTNWIFLCPFFKILVVQPSPNVCPAVKSNQFGDLWGFLVQNQMYILFHEILHFYLNNQPAPMVQDGSAEVYDPNKAAALSSLDAISNAQSYVLYVASKSSFLLQLPVTPLEWRADFLLSPSAPAKLCSSDGNAASRRLRSLSREVSGGCWNGC